MPAPPPSRRGPENQPAPATTTTVNGPANGALPAGVPAGLGSLPGLVAAGGRTGASALTLLPAGMPLPAGAAGVYGVSAGTTTAVVFTVPDGSSVISFYQSALTTAGYTVSTATSGFPISFTGNGITRGLVNVSANTVGISLYGAAPAPTTPAPTTPAPTAPAVTTGTAAPISIAGNSLVRSVTCDGGTVIIRGNSDKVTIAGHCAQISIIGNSDAVIVDAADTIGITGNSVDVTVHSGSPAVTKTGSFNNVHNG